MHAKERRPSMTKIHVSTDIVFRGLKGWATAGNGSGDG
jgi:hypothetical protein